MSNNRHSESDRERSRAAVPPEALPAQPRPWLLWMASILLAAWIVALAAMAWNS